MSIRKYHFLALETSSSLCDVALLSVDGAAITLRSVSHDATGEHAQRLLPMVDELLMQAGLRRTDLSAIAFGQGPGGFTGLRVACGVAQGMAFALDIPVIPVGSLQAAALGDTGDEPVRVVVQDARMSEVYLAAYKGRSDQIWQEVHKPVLMAVEDVVPWVRAQAGRWLDTELKTIRVTGDALAAYPELARSALESNDEASDDIVLCCGAPVRACAEAVAKLGWQAWQDGRMVAAHEAAPLYVRDKVAYTTAERDQGMGGNPKAQTPMSIRAMTNADIDEVARIERSVQSFPWTLGNFHDAMRAGYSAWVATRGEQLQGFAVMMFAPDVAHLMLLAVRPDAQQAGIGHTLLRHCERVALAHGQPAILLEVRPSNKRAITFYQKHGFAQIAIRKDYYPRERQEREDAMIMQKQLDDGLA